VQILDDAFQVLWKGKKAVTLAAGPSVTKAELGQFTLPVAYHDRFFFVKTELRDKTGKLISRSVYWPRSTSKLDDAAFQATYLKEATAWPTFENGPFLKPTVAKTQTTLTLAISNKKALTADRSQIRVRVKNEGKVPAFMVQVDVSGTKRAMVADDNFFWLEPGESRELSAEILWREPETKSNATFVLKAFNGEAKPVHVEK